MDHIASLQPTSLVYESTMTPVITPPGSTTVTPPRQLRKRRAPASTAGSSGLSDTDVDEVDTTPVSQRTRAFSTSSTPNSLTLASTPTTHSKLLLTPIKRSVNKRQKSQHVFVQLFSNIQIAPVNTLATSSHAQLPANVDAALNNLNIALSPLETLCLLCHLVHLQRPAANQSSAPLSATSPLTPTRSSTVVISSWLHSLTARSLQAAILQLERSAANNAATVAKSVAAHLTHAFRTSPAAAVLLPLKQLWTFSFVLFRMLRRTLDIHNATFLVQQLLATHFALHSALLQQFLQYTQLHEPNRRITLDEWLCLLDFVCTVQIDAVRQVLYVEGGDLDCYPLLLERYVEWLIEEKWYRLHGVTSDSEFTPSKSSTSMSFTPTPSPASSMSEFESARKPSLDRQSAIRSLPLSLSIEHLHSHRTPSDTDEVRVSVNTEPLSPVHLLRPRLQITVSSPSSADSGETPAALFRRRAAVTYDDVRTEFMSGNEYDRYSSLLMEGR